MRHTWDRDPRGSLSFAKPERVRAERCGNLEYLFPTSMARGLVQLQDIDISDRAVLEKIVARWDEILNDQTPDDQLLFPQLTSLRFRRLQNLKRLFPVNYSLDWSSLKTLHAFECGKLKMFASEALQSSEGDDTGFQQALVSIVQVIPNLEVLGLGIEDVLIIKDGDFLDDLFRNLKILCLACFGEGSVGFLSRFLLDFPNLKIEGLILGGFLFEEIFLDEAGKYLKALQKLRELQLVQLCNLRYVWKEGSLAAEILKRIELLGIERCHRLKTVFPEACDSFENLTKLNIEKCDGIRYLMAPSAARGLPKLARMTIQDCEMMGEIQ
ncbi:uncharacterized protein LOC116203131 [Punica granatum]|uniref:Uncharacterized protein LOC116203131 n=1 Tax=Punica granatum TaxID=22663 RepID=A0A6P8DB13_PUNGR|nr:uncharacterized protein LOC116203131 [Punica granatum]